MTVSEINPEKFYTVTYLAPHQSKARTWEYGEFKLLGKDLTHNQIQSL